MESFTVKQAAEAIGVTAEMIRRYIAKGQLKADRFGVMWQIPAAAIKAFERPKIGRPPQKIRKRVQKK